MQKNYKSFFSLFNYPKDTVLRVVKTLNINERNLLYKKYGNNLENVIFVSNLTLQEIKEINERILRKIRLRLNGLDNDMCIVSISDIFPKENLEDIKIAMMKTNTLVYFQKLFDYDLSGLCYTYKTDNIRNNINKDKVFKVKQYLIKSKGLYKVKIIRPFFSLFLKYKRSNESYIEFEERLRVYVNSMIDKYKNAIFSLYNEDLNNVILMRPGTKDVRRMFSEAYSIIIRKLKSDMNENKRNDSVKSLCNTKITLEQIIERQFALINAKNLYGSSIHKAFSEFYSKSISYGLILYFNFSDYLTLDEICLIADISNEELICALKEYDCNLKRRVIK